MVVRISDKTQNYSKVTKLLVKPYSFNKFFLPFFKWSWITQKNRTAH